LVEFYPAESSADAQSTILAQENEGLARENAELRLQLAFMSGRLATANAGMVNSWPLDLYWQTDVKPIWPAMSRSRDAMDCSSIKQTRARSRDASPAASTTASTCGFLSEVDSISDCENTSDREELHLTTTMMRNIPSEYTRTDLLDLLDRKGFNGLYDLVYMPIAFQTGLNHGYAFINFTTAEDANSFVDHFSGFSDWLVESDRICEVSWSDQSQGLDSNVQRYRDSPVMHESVEDRFKPVLFRQGQRIPFPKPTKTIRAPRLRK